ncbi:BamA/TamA family outer membrane protein [Bacteroidota bacterium]
MNNPGKLICLFSLLLLMSCATQEPFYNESVSDWESNAPGTSSDLVYQVYLIGDSRQVYEDEDLVKLMNSNLRDAGENSAVVFLGNNIESGGSPDSTQRNWEKARESLDAHLDMLGGFQGEVYFIPGNHDWNKGRRDGLENVKNQRKFIENNLDKKQVFLPGKGRPGPIEINLSDDIVLILFDSHWWFHEHDKNYAGIADEADIFVQIEDAVSRNRDKKIIIAAHHPLYSVGMHGGHFPGSSLIFPLLEINPALYVPLPGFLYTGYRKIFGAGQDLSNPHYKILNEALLETFEGHPNIIFAAAHDHNLQYVEKDGIHHIVSGAAGMSDYAAQSKKTDFAQMQEGFARLAFYSNGDVWLEFITSGDKLTFRQKLFNKIPFEEKLIQQNLSEIDYSDSTITTYPNGEKYQASKFKKVFFGENYRDEWIIPVEVPVFDFNNEKGGLKIVKKGGGGQTKSLRLENDLEQQWVLRSLEKDPSKVIPEVVKMQLAIDLAQDQMSAYLPWAALSVPRLADAAGIYHTNPKIVYLTSDPRLGPYRDDVWEGLYLFEERPNGNRKDVESFGRSEDIIGTPDMFDEIEADHDNRMDQEHFLRCRMFDVFINDWDRHEDQWRWAKFEKKGDEVTYRAVPRDRDQTFFLNEGLFPWISSRKFALRMNQGFDYDIEDMGGLVSQGKWLDRRFLNELNKKDWINAAEKMQTAFTDEILTAAINDMPGQIAEVKASTTISKLKSRRDKLPSFAEEHYSIISKKVDVVGSDKREQFLVERLNNKETEVKVWSLNNDGKKKDKIYERKFKHDETREIRLYGLGGKDEFDVEGKVEKGMKVRIIGGAGKDDIKDKSKVKGPGKKTLIYDTKKKNNIDFGKEAADRTSNLPERNSYTYAAFNYNKFIPLAFFGFNADEALVLGAGFLYTTYGFQKSPYSSHHSLGARYATATSALEFQYEGKYKSILGRFDLNFHFIIRDPRYTYNYFGLGNETPKVSPDKDYNRVRIGQLHVFPELSRTINQNTFAAGLFYQQFDVENTQGRYISDIPANGLNPDIFNRQRYAGISIRYELDTRNDKVLPTRGIYWNSFTLFYYSLTESSHTYNRLASDLGLFLSFRKPYRTVLAFRFGGAINAGSYEFYQAASIGGNSNLRGHRSDRYAGDASLYQNTELRFKLFDFSTYFAIGEFGLLGFNDFGRVWLGGEDSKVWHHGYGGGLWMSPFRLAVLSATYEWSKDEPSGLFSLRFRFLF